jgi:fatty-acyl-CoA synthase
VAQLDERVRRVASALATAGVRRDDHVGLLLPAGLDLIALLFACFRLGATAVPISDRFKAAELAYVIEHADLAALVTTASLGEHADFPALIDEALAQTRAPRLRSRVVVDDAARPGYTPLRRLLGGADAPAATVSPDDVAFIMYTSGTSAAPKGALLSHRGFSLQGAAVAERWDVRRGDRYWCPLPLFHNGGIAALLGCLSAGASFVHPGRFDADTALEQLEQERCTHALPAFEALWTPVLEHPRFAEADLSALRLVEHSGVPQLLRRIQSRVPVGTTVVANYGLTEASGHLCITPPDESLTVRTETSGHPLRDMEVRVIDPEMGRPLAPGEPGEITFRGPMRALGYYKEPELTAEAIDDDGWFRTGDRGMLDADGRLVFLGRLKDMLKVGGENVSAAEVEAFLLTHPAIRSVQVVGAPDERYSEVPAAFVELVAGETMSERQLIEYCLGQIATFKVPRYARFVAEWPMSGTKVQKFALRERIARELREAGTTEAPRLSSGGARAAPRADR